MPMLILMQRPSIYPVCMINQSKRSVQLPASLLAFEDVVYPLEDSWVQSGGLGHDYGISRVDIEKAAALHYNGVMKSWLDLGKHDYK
jgi:alpha-1,4-galacturonosyltransferase